MAKDISNVVDQNTVVKPPEFGRSESISSHQSFAAQEALATLRFGIATRKGLIVITGVAGSGKTTLLSKVLCELDANVQHVLIPCPVASLSEVLRLTLRNLGIAQQDQTRLAMIHRLRTHLLKQFENGRIVALIFDDAHKLTDQVLEQIIGLMLLFEVRDTGEKLLQMVLLGRRQLEKKLGSQRLLPLKRHVALSCHLPRLPEGRARSHVFVRASAPGPTDNCSIPANATEPAEGPCGSNPVVINDLCGAPGPKTGTHGKKNHGPENVEKGEIRLDSGMVPESGVSPSAVFSGNAPGGADPTQCQSTMPEEKRPLEQEEAFWSERKFESSRIPIMQSRTLRVSIALAVLLLVAGVSLTLAPLNLNDYMDAVPAGPGQIMQSGRKSIIHILGDPERSAMKEVPPVFAEIPETSLDVPVEEVIAVQPSNGILPNENAVSQPDKNASNQSLAAEGADQGMIATGKTVTAGSPRNALADEDVRRRSLMLKIRERIDNRAISGVEVFVIDRTAYLDGQVATERQKRAAGQAAAMVPEVEHVENRIVVK